MNLKKIIASVAAASIAVTSMATISASAITAGATTIDFEDGDHSFVYLNLDAGSDNSVLSVEEYNGSKQLKVDIQDKAAVPKVWFDLDSIMDRANTVNIRKITFDLTVVPKNAEDAVGWIGGAIGAAGGFDLAVGGSSQKDPAWSQGTWEGGAYDPGVAAEVKMERKFLMGNEFYTETGVNPFFGVMKWASEVDQIMYIDNIQFLDKDGKNITVGVTAAEAPAEEPAAEETTEAPAEEATTEAPAEEAPAEEAVEEVAVEEPEAEVAPAPAPEADTTTAPVATGNAAVASIAAVMAIAGAAAIASKKRN